MSIGTFIVENWNYYSIPIVLTISGREMAKTTVPYFKIHTFSGDRQLGTRDLGTRHIGPRHLGTGQFGTLERVELSCT